MSAIITKIVRDLKKTIMTSSWQRQRSSSELQSFVDRMSARVSDVELDIAQLFVNESARLALPEACVDTFFSQEFFVSAILDNTAVIEHDNTIQFCNC